MKTKPKNDWLEALASVCVVEAPGPEWKTRRQLEEEFKITRSPMDRALRSLIESGKAEVRKFTIGKVGSRRQVPHYRLK